MKLRAAQKLTVIDRGRLAVLASVQAFGANDIGMLYSRFRNLESVWSATRDQLLGVGLSILKVNRLVVKRKEVEPLEYLEWLESLGVVVVSVFDEDYPPLLKQTTAAPYVLFVRGELKSSGNPALAVVGTRKPTSYGRQVCGDLVEQLVASGVTIISGLALGIDAIAHKKAVDMGGITTGVLGNGIDNIYPSSNNQLGEQIIRGGGALVSEYAPGVPSLRQNFPARNRLISGMSLGVLVVEGARGSGSLITAKFALEQGRKLFAVPGAITNPMSVGPNELISAGASMVGSAEDILSELEGDGNQRGVLIDRPDRVGAKPKFDSNEEKIIYSLLEKGELHVDEVVVRSGMATAKVVSLLTVLEVKKVIRHVGNKKYSVLYRSGEI